MSEKRTVVQKGKYRGTYTLELTVGQVVLFMDHKRPMNDHWVEGKIVDFGRHEPTDSDTVKVRYQRIFGPLGPSGTKRNDNRRFEWRIQELRLDQLYSPNKKPLGKWDKSTAQPYPKDEQAESSFIEALKACV
jgi:hypothetical protein